MSFFRAISVVLIMSTLAGARAWAKSDGEIEESIRNVLAQRHPSDTGDWWKGLGATAPRVIISMYESSTNIYHRSRLIGALGWYDDSRAVEYLKQQASNTTDDVIRETAIKSVGLSQGSKEIDFVSQFLQNPDAQTRLAAAQTIQRMGDARSKAVLDQYVKDEKTTWIVGRLRGEFPKPTGQLVAVSSSDDKVSSVFSGSWKGVLVSPEDGPSGMKALPVTMRVMAEPNGDLRGELSWTIQAPDKTSKAKSGAVEGLSAKGLRITGILPLGLLGDDLKNQHKTSPLAHPRYGSQSAPRPNPSQTPERVSFEADLLEQAGARILRVQAPKMAAFLILRKE